MANKWVRIEVEVSVPENSPATEIENKLNKLAERAFGDTEIQPFRNVRRIDGK